MNRTLHLGIILKTSEDGISSRLDEGLEVVHRPTQIIVLLVSGWGKTCNPIKLHFISSSGNLESHY